MQRVLLRHGVLALALVLAVTAGPAAAQERTPTPRPVLSTTDGRVQVFSEALSPLSEGRRGEGPTLSVDGFASSGGLGSGEPSNTVLLLPIGAGNALIGIGWEVHLTAHDPNWLSDAGVAFLPNAGGPGLWLTPAEGINAAGSGDFSSEGVVMLADIDVAPVPSGAGGTLYLEFYSAFSSPSTQPIEWANAGAPAVLPPGLRLICTDQAACDAAVQGGGGPGDSEMVLLTASDGAANDWFGRDVAIDGTTALVGADAADVNGVNNRGAAYVYELVGGAWVQQAKLTASDGAASNQFGISVALSGNTAVVGTGSAEAAYVFRRVGGTWTEEAKLTAGDGGTGDRFGIAVGVDGDLVVVGARQANVGGFINQGAAYVFVRQGSQWTQQAKLTASNGQAYDLFGSAVALSEGTVVVGAASADPEGQSNRGAAWVFGRQGSGWAEQAMLTADDGAAGHRFGESVALSGDLAVVGAPQAGAAYAFVRTDTSWSQQARLTVPGGASAWMGNAVAAHGDRALVGALFADEAYLFRRENGAWGEGFGLATDEVASGGQFGNAVALSQDRALVGAWQTDVGGTSAQGAAYVVSLSGGEDPPPPQDDVLAFDPEVLVKALMAGETGTATVTVVNTTDEPVDYTFIQYADGVPRAAPAQHRALHLPKGAPDPRPAMAPGRGQGGPDGFGYTWIDSNEPGGPEYDWIDISATGTVVPLTDDDSRTVDLPFSFEFYGQEQTSIRIVSNGWLGFGGTTIAYVNQPIPTPDEPNNFIAPFWDDLNPVQGGTILYQDMGDGRFVVSYLGVPHHPDDGAATFQAILYRHGAIKFQYQSIDFPVEGTASATIGIENADGTDGLQVVYNAPYVEDELAVLIQARPTFVPEVTPVSGTIPAGGSALVTVTFDATALIGGTYEGRLTAEAAGGTYDLPVVLEVTGEPCLVLDPATLDFGAVLVNASATLEATATNCGTDVTTLSALATDHADYAFSLDGSVPLALAPGASAVIAVTFTPSSESAIEGTLSVLSDAPGAPHVVMLTGIGAPPPDLSVEPAELVFTVDAGALSEPQLLTLTNAGDGEGTFAIVTIGGQQRRLPVSGRHEAGVEDEPRLDEQRPGTARGAMQPQAGAFAPVGPPQASFTHPASFAGEDHAGPAPGFERASLRSPLNLRGGESSVAFGHDASTGHFGSFDFLTPGVFDPISSLPADSFVGAGALGTDPEVAYQVDGSVLYRVSTATGVATPVGDLGADLSGMTYDPTTRTFYGIPFVSAPAPTPLYVIDVVAGTLTQVGIGAYSAGIALASTPGGELYTYSINTDELLRLDKATGEATVIGSIGFDANFGQGMTYDYVNDVMYMTAFNMDTFQPELRSVNLETGHTTFVGELGVDQMGWAGAVARGPQFLVVTPEEGTVPAQGETPVEVRIDASGLNGGTYEAGIVIATNDPLAPEFVVDVTVHVIGAPGVQIDPGALAFGEVIAGTEAAQVLTVTNSGTDPLSVSGITSSSDAFTVEAVGAFELGVGESTSVAVTFAPGAPGAYTGTLTVVSNAESSPDQVAIMGTGVAAPVADVDPAAVTLDVAENGGATTTLALSNLAADGAAGLTFSVAVIEGQAPRTRLHGAPAVGRGTAHGPSTSSHAAPNGSRGEAAQGSRSEGGMLRRADGASASGAWREALDGPRAVRRGGEAVTVTHSLSQAVEELAGIACGGPEGTTQNAFWRVFDLSDFDLTGGFDVTSVDVGIETASVSTPTTVRLYTLDGAFTTSNLTLVAEATHTVGPVDLTVVTLPVEGAFANDDVLVVEWDVPNLQSVGGFVYPGANAAGQTGPTYIQAAEGCGLEEPTDAADLGFPGSHWVLNVNGTSGPGLLSVTPESGVVAPGASQELTLTVDAGDIAVGTYHLEVQIVTNDPERPVVTVPVAVNVGTVSGEEGATPGVFALEPNYPNPFSARTRIEYALPEPSHVRIQVYDSVGRLVTTLVEGHQAAGTHQLEWEARGLASGVYFYRIEAGAFQRTHRMILMR